MDFEYITSPEYRILQRDSHDEEMYSSLARLKLEQPNILRKLFGVCSRLRFIDNIKYNTDKQSLIFYPPLWGENIGDDKSFNYQVDRLRYVSMI